MPTLRIAEEAYRERQKPAERQMVVGLLARLANHFSSAERDAVGWQMLFEDYADDLAEISEPHLREVLGEYRRSKPFFPKIAEIVQGWQTIQRVEAEKLRRARVLLGLEDAKPWEAA